MGSTPSRCAVKNRLGQDVEAVCWLAAAGADQDAVQRPASALFEGVVEHGSELAVEAPEGGGAAIWVAIRPVGLEAFAVAVPSGATLLLRDYGAGVARVCREGAQAWEAPAALPAAIVFAAPADATPSPHEAAAEPVSSADRPVASPAGAAVAKGGGGASPSAQGGRAASPSRGAAATGGGADLGVEVERSDVSPGRVPTPSDIGGSLRSAPPGDDFALCDLGYDQGWSEERRELFGVLLDHGFAPVRARKSLEASGADTVEEAIEWLERHQDDDDIDVPVEREAYKLALHVMRLATVPAAQRRECVRALHGILGRILEDPESQRWRQIRLSNEKFQRQLGRHPQATALLRAVGFRQGDYWVSATRSEPCLEFVLPVDSDNPVSQRFVQAYSLLDELVRAPDPNAEAEEAASTSTAAADGGSGSRGGTTSATEEGGGGGASEGGASEGAGGISSACSRREFLAQLHERRARDPWAFQEAMRAAGKRPNTIIVDVRARRLAEPQAEGAAPNLSERFGGRRHFDLQDLEKMRVEDAIDQRTSYAKEYQAQHGPAHTYGELVTRSYDPKYLGLKAIDETNNFRALQRMPPLRWSQGIADIAARHAGQMARGEMPFSHKGFDERVRQYPVPHFSAAENLAYNSGVHDAAAVAVQGWINSPGHRKNLLGAFDLCGIGVARSADGHFFFTQLFARTGALC